MKAQTLEIDLMINNVRRLTGLSMSKLATLLFMHTVTLYRWNSVRSMGTSVDPMRMHVLNMLNQMLTTMSSNENLISVFVDKLNKCLDVNPAAAVHFLMNTYDQLMFHLREFGSVDSFVPESLDPYGVTETAV